MLVQVTERELRRVVEAARQLELELSRLVRALEAVQPPMRDEPPNWDQFRGLMIPES